MELALLLSLIVLLGGLWIFLYNAVLDLTVKAPADYSLLLLGVAHWTVLCYLALALYVFYHAGIASRTKHRPSSRAKIAEGILLESWPVTLASLVVGFISAKVGNSEFLSSLSMWLLFAAGILFPIYRKWKRRPTDDRGIVRASHLTYFLLGVSIFSIPYMMIMSTVLADVQITTDKDFYNISDTMLVSVHSAGYIFRPDLKRLQFGLYQSGSPFDRTFAVTPELRANQDLIMVDYRPQLGFWVRTAYHSVNVVKKED